MTVFITEGRPCSHLVTLTTCKSLQSVSNLASGTDISLSPYEQNGEKSQIGHSTPYPSSSILNNKIGVICLYTTHRGGEGIAVVYLGFGCRWGAQAAGVCVIPLLGTAPRWRATRQWRRGGWRATRALHESAANGEGVLDVDTVAHLSGAGASMATATRQGSEGVRETRSHGR